MVVTGGARAGGSDVDPPSSSSTSSLATADLLPALEDEEEAAAWAGRSSLPTVKEIVVFRHPPVVHVYNVLEHGRRYFRSLVYSSDARFCLHDMEPRLVLAKVHGKGYRPQYESGNAGVRTLYLFVPFFCWPLVWVRQYGHTRSDVDSHAALVLALHV